MIPDPAGAAKTAISWGTLIAGLPAVLAPSIAWLLSQIGVGRRTKDIEHLQKRIELVERLRPLQENNELKKRQFNEKLDAVVMDIVEDLAAFRETEQPVHAAAIQAQSRWRRFFLLYEQASIKGRIYRVLFYMFLFFAVAMPVLYSTMGSSVGVKQGGVGVGLFSGVFYMVLCLLFRSAAVSNYRKMQKKADLVDKKSST